MGFPWFPSPVSGGWLAVAACDCLKRILRLCPHPEESVLSLVGSVCPGGRLHACCHCSVSGLPETGLCAMALLAGGSDQKPTCKVKWSSRMVRMVRANRLPRNVGAQHLHLAHQVDPSPSRPAQQSVPAFHACALKLAFPVRIQPEVVWAWWQWLMGTAST